MHLRASVNWVLQALVVLLPVAVLAADEPKSSETTDPDFVVQGEYQGEIAESEAKTKTKIGVQVVALGKGKFRSVTYLGGLPGDGWDKSETVSCDGESLQGVTTFTNDQGTAKIEDGVLAVSTKQGGNGKLKKIVRLSPTLGAKPPEGAVVLFAGKDVEQFLERRVTADGLLRPGATSKLKFQSGTLHVEFQTPFAPLVPSRGNSGVYLQSRYEVQILDSFGFKSHNHECGGIPSVRGADVVMSFPPLSWQTYDVKFTAAQFENGQKVKSARMTIRHNDVLIHDDVEVPHATTSSPLPEGPEPGPLNFQEHGSEVRFRNIWFLPQGDAAQRGPG